ncbi:hypothetical protein GCM10010401_21450 [Rarobacter faecitabidus]|uniref:Acetone carboxylase n=1 Tax=Rarobacter faecitabidus TaxID=13243 RepID=A0A542ZVL6_RARFA|nr:hypothetical protein [Rarobacter faecitabidus]TQL64349.1 hypothetical protein FB461_0851 [Rarobacter faecitabidus]
MTDAIDEPQICNSKRCTEPAEFAVRWNNPKVHTPDRRKIWAACPGHVDHLQRFLELRGFWLDTVPLVDADD